MEMSLARWMVIAAAVLSLGASAAEDALVRARQLYNQHQYDAAIAAATEARKRPALEAAADVVIGRSLLERHRRTSAPTDLDAARAALARLDPTRLTPRDRGEWVVGLGEWLYFARQYGPAAEMFDAALGFVGEMDIESRERVTEWWALAVDAQAQAADETRRVAIYRRMLARMEVVERSEPSVSAAYWLAVAAAGADDVDRAWDAAVASWVRASAAGAQMAALRDDIDRLVQQRLLPERVRRAASGDGSRRAAALRAEWESIKRLWPPRQ
jgi:hypothetical protein